MSAKQLQQQIIQQLIRTSPIRIKLDSVNQIGNETPDAYSYGLGCLECGNQFIYIIFQQGKEAEWQSLATQRLQQHIEIFHKK